MRNNVANILIVLLVLVVIAMEGCGIRESSTTNVAPSASAGTVQKVATGVLVTLDGSGSSDANNDPLSYKWAVTSKPYGSAVTLSDTNAVKPVFTPDIAGSYLFCLVVSDGNTNSAAAVVTVTASVANTAPSASAGADQSVSVGSTVTLDGSGSNDANHNLLSFQWVLTSKPPGSVASLSNTTMARPLFIADVAGVYIINLVVKNDYFISITATTTVTASVGNIAPVANAGADKSAVAGAIVTLDGRGSSDANNDPLTYRWVFTSKPEGSTPELINPSSVQPYFTANDVGTYVLSLVVNDGRVDSVAAIVRISASKPEPIVAMETTMGTIKIALYETAAPISTTNFLDYVNAGFYANTLFHRVIKDFMIQGGGYIAGSFVQKPTNAPIKNEATNGLKNLRGTVAMARTDVIDSATSQFFINVKDNAFLNYVDSNAAGYAVFGRVVEGMDIVDKIAAVATGTYNGTIDVPVDQVIIVVVKVIQ